MGQETLIITTLMEIKEDIGGIKKELSAAVKEYGERIDNHDARIAKIEEQLLKSSGAKEARKPFWVGCWDIAKMFIVFGLGVISQILFKRSGP